jgi:hypothetical protein
MALLDGALAEGSSLMGAAVVQGAVLAVPVRHAEGDLIERDGLDAAFIELVRLEDLLPDERAGGSNRAHRRTPA